MAGQGISGVLGDCKIGSTQVSELVKWSFAGKCNNPSYNSNKTAGYKRRVSGVREGSGSIDGKWDPTTPVVTVIAVGTSVTLLLYLDATANYIVPSVIDTLTVNVDVDTGEIVSWTSAFSTNGAWTEPGSGMRSDGPDGISDEAPLMEDLPPLRMAQMSDEDVSRIAAQVAAYMQAQRAHELRAMRINGVDKVSVPMPQRDFAVAA